MGRHYSEIPLWKSVTPEQWNDWRWQVANRITTVDQLRQVINLTPEEEEVISGSLNKLRMAITPYYASLMDPDDPHDPIRMQAVPTIFETHISPDDLEDPCHEDIDSPTPGLTHRYPDRGMLMITDECSMYCRHCTRRRKAGETDRFYPREQIKAALDYIRATPTFRDLLLSGGDPFVCNDDLIEWVLKEARSIPHLEIVRFGTRTPVVMPQRITDDLCRILKKYHPIWLNTHFNHPKELTPESREACAKLADAGIPLGNQSVLLRNINDCPYTMRELCQQLMTARVRPYYIYQCDLSMGIEHFRTSVAKGIEIMEYLRGHTSGLAVPSFIIDGPGGGGKIPILPNYLLSMSDDRVVIRNYEGVITTYSQPKDRTHTCDPQCQKFCERQKAFSREGLIKLLEGEQVSIEPADLTRRMRPKKAWRQQQQ